MPPVRASGVDLLPSGRFRVRVRRSGRRAAAVLPTLEAAVAWRTAAVEALASGLEPPAASAPPPPRRPSVVAPSGDPTVADAARLLGAGIRAGTVRGRSGRPFKPSVSRRYESSLRVHVLPRIGLARVCALRRRDVQALVDALAADESAETARKALTALRTALRVAERDGWLEVNPCAGVRIPADPAGERPVRVLDRAEAAAIVAAAEAHDARLGRSLAGPLFSLAFGTGLRSGELLALRWGPEGLDVDEGIVRVRWNVDRKRGPDGVYAIVTPKSRASVRDVPLPPSDRARLRAHRLASGRPPDGALVFPGPDGGPAGPNGAVRYAWRAAIEASGIAEPSPRFHDTRHAWAVAALRAGLRPEAVAKLGGWATVALVLGRYGRHALPHELADAGILLDRWRAAE